MLSEEQIAVLRQHVANAIVDELTRANIDWGSFDRLANPSLCIEAEFRDRPADDLPKEQNSAPGLTISVCLERELHRMHAGGIADIKQSE